METDRLVLREGSTSSGQAESPQTIAHRQQEVPCGGRSGESNGLRRRLGALGDNRRQDKRGASKRRSTF